MEQETQKRVRRSKEEITQDKIQKLEAKIADYKEKIAEAEKEIEALKNPPAPEIKMKDIKDKIEEYGLPLDEVMKSIEKMGKKK